MSEQFVHLRVHTEFSLIDSLIRTKKLVAAVANQKMPAVAVSDHCNFFGLVKFYKAALGSGVQPIFAADFYLRDEIEAGEHSLITFIARNAQGYQNITQLISKAWQLGQERGMSFITHEWIEEHADGLIVLSGARRGDVGRALLNGNQALAEKRLSFWQRLFPDAYYVEVQRTGRPQEEEYIRAAVKLASDHQLPLLATNDVVFLQRSDFEAHEARVCIYQGYALDDPRRPNLYSEEQYLRSAEEMQALFADLPSAIANTTELAKRCAVEMRLGEYFLPDFPVPDGMTMDEFFREISYKGLQERLDFLFDRNDAKFPEIEQEYIARLEYELDIIIQMGFPGYFLIVMDFIQWAKDHDIPVGPGRGSGAGSLVAYVLKITDLDPIEYDLLFERFLNPERVSMPDFDVDFCMDNRDKVISYVAEHYGRDAVSQIVTFGTMAAKAVIRDVARVQGKSYGLADKLSKMVPFRPGITLAEAYDEEEPMREFLRDDEEAQEIWDMAIQLEGVVRGVGKHAGGVVISPTKITDFAAIYCDEHGEGIVTQFDKGDVEDAGLVKFDFLGLRTLTIIDWAKKMIDRKRAKLGEEELVVLAIPLQDAPTFSLLQKAETTAVFQLESRGMKDLIKRLRPDSFEDLIALVALFRPGPLESGMVDNFINRKHGREKVSYPDAQYQHECLVPILEPTYGIILYQEQVMQIAQELAGYTLGGADLLRRAMGKKKPEEMAKQRSTFESGAIENGVSGELAMKIFDLVEKFAGYGFNKSHSAAYALVSYHTAWLKTHYPAEFMAATMSSELQNTDKIVIFIDECRSMDMAPMPPDVNTGDYMFTVNEKDEIIYGLGAIKGLGEGPVESLLAARREGGSFTDLFDFCRRVDLRKVNKRALEALIRAGAFDALGEERSMLLAALPEAVKVAEQSSQNASAGISDLFGEVVSASGDDDVYAEYRHVRVWTTTERLAGEKDTLGLYLTGHPIDDYIKEIRCFCRNKISELKADRAPQTICGIVTGLRLVKTRRGDTMAIVTIDDRTARLEVAIFSDVYQDNRDKLLKDEIVLLEGEIRFDDYSGGLKMSTSAVYSLAEARRRFATGIELDLHHNDINLKQVKQLQELLQPLNPQGSPVFIAYQQEHARAEIRLGEDWHVSPKEDLMQRLREAYGNDAVRMKYGSS